MFLANVRNPIFYKLPHFPKRPVLFFQNSGPTGRLGSTDSYMTHSFLPSLKGGRRDQGVSPFIINNVNMYVCKYVHVNVYICVYVYMCMCGMCVYVVCYVCMYVCMYVCIYACMHACMYVCIYRCMYLSREAGRQAGR